MPCIHNTSIAIIKSKIDCSAVPQNKRLFDLLRHSNSSFLSWTLLYFEIESQFLTRAYLLLKETINFFFFCFAFNHEYLKN
jgi:hypothetical protein